VSGGTAQLILMLVTEWVESSFHASGQGGLTPKEKVSGKK